MTLQLSIEVMIYADANARAVAEARAVLGAVGPVYLLAQLLTPMMTLAETYARHRPDQAIALLEEALVLGRSTIGEGADLGGMLLERAGEVVGMLERAIAQPVHWEIARGCRIIREARRALANDEAAEAAICRA